MSHPNNPMPRALSAILRDLFTTRGYRSSYTLRLLEEAWNQAVGTPACRQTRIINVRRGVLHVTVAHSGLLEELKAFRKAELLMALHRIVGVQAIHDIVFRIGPIRSHNKWFISPPSSKGKNTPS
jgi:hypothetical protein